jgi:hypothetical protein
MGEALISELTTATGLPEDLMTDELTRLIANAGLRPEQVTLDDLRKILAEYVQDILLAAQEEHSSEQGR